MAEATKQRGFWKIALACLVLIEVLGGLSGWLSNSGYGNGWFDTLRKPMFMPPGWAFGVVWPILYALMGVALAMVLADRTSDRRRFALTLFFIQLALNLSCRRSFSRRMTSRLPNGSFSSWRSAPPARPGNSCGSGKPPGY